MFRYDPRFLDGDEADALFGFCREQEYLEYPFRGRRIRRSPTVEFRLHERVGVYKWGQERAAYGYGTNGLPDILRRAWERIGDPALNHVLVIRYTGGRDHHIPWHSDKTRTMVPGSSIYNLVVCDRPRVFQLARPEHIQKKTDGHGEASVYEFDSPMTHGSMLSLTWEGNQTLRHRVPKNKGWTGERYSIVFRAIREIETVPVVRVRLADIIPV